MSLNIIDVHSEAACLLVIVTRSMIYVNLIGFSYSFVSLGGFVSFAFALLYFILDNRFSQKR